MKRFLPQTLFAQTLLLLLLGIALSLLVGAWIYSSARHEAVQSVGALAAAERIINLSRLIDEVPVAWRQRLVAGSNDATFRVELMTSQPVFPATGDNTPATGLVADFLRQALPAHNIFALVMRGTKETPIRSASPREQTSGFQTDGSGQANQPSMMQGRMMRHNMMRRRMMRHRKMMNNSFALASMSWRGLRAAVQLEDGPWLSFATSLPETGPQLSPRLLWALLAMTMMIALLTTWAVRRMTAPLRILSDAAMRLGRNVEAPPLLSSGSVEMRQASDAFNQMQKQLRRLIENRTLMLGAISHDLRTHLTLLRLRLEGMDKTGEHERMLKNIGEMEGMLNETLSFSRDEASGEKQKRVDLGALLASIVDDMADADMDVTLEPIQDETILPCKPLALRRALINVMENAVKYGDKANLALSATPESVEITIEDEGPGIPEDQLDQVMQPFYRLESSRNRETGGIGLGLAIASSIIEAHCGELLVANRHEGGLEVTFTLPR